MPNWDLEVCETHIEKGLKRDCYNNPVALAMRDSKYTKDVMVDPLVIEVCHDGVLYVGKTSDKLSKFLLEFDAGKKVKSFRELIELKQLGVYYEKGGLLFGSQQCEHTIMDEYRQVRDIEFERAFAKVISIVRFGSVSSNDYKYIDDFIGKTPWGIPVVL